MSYEYNIGPAAENGPWDPFRCGGNKVDHAVQW